MAKLPDAQGIPSHVSRVPKPAGLTATGYAGEARGRAINRVAGSIRGFFSVRKLIVPIAGSFLLYLAMFLLAQSPTYGLVGTRTLRRWSGLRAVSRLLMPNSVIDASRHSEQAIVNAGLYGLVVLGLVSMWALALWLVRPGAETLKLRWILLPVGLFSLPLIWFPAMFSCDLYLYIFYGRTISHYGQNPILVSPLHHSDDAVISWIRCWRGLPSSYGPVWLMLAGSLSAIAGDARFANIFTYKAGLLGLHVLTIVAVWSLLRRTRPELATWGAVFYGWNPLVLLETIGSGHNDAVVGLYAALSLLAVANRRWPFAVFFIVAAAMVKLPALLPLPLLALTWILSSQGARAKIMAAVGAGMATVVSGLVLYSPFWAGTALLRNVRKNPAATRYYNSLWELLARKLVVGEGKGSLPDLLKEFNTVRLYGFGAAYLLLIWYLWKRRSLADAWVWLWFVYCLWASWIWPWYFVAVVPIAAVCGPGRSAWLAAGLTVGGMLFWLDTPSPKPLTWLAAYRSVVMFAPAILALLWPVLSRRVGQVAEPRAPVRSRSPG